MSAAIVLDTETTGTGETAKVIEFARSQPIDTPVGLMVAAKPVNIACDRYSPGDQPIALGAMAAHHIIEDDLEGLPPFPGFDWPPDVTYIIGHNVDFDWKMIGQPKLKRICTLALCRNLWPQIDSHTLSAMVYHLHERRDVARGLLRNAHSAETDVLLLLKVVLPAILRAYGPMVGTWEELWALSEKARVPTIMPWGKHKGIHIGDIPGDYKRWLLNQPDVDPYLAIALRGGRG
jgi:exodeoxyribonuclease X